VLLIVDRDMQVRKRPTTAPSPPPIHPSTHPPARIPTYPLPSHTPATGIRVRPTGPFVTPAFSYEHPHSSSSPPPPRRPHSHRLSPFVPGPHLPVHTSRSTPPGPHLHRGGSTGGGDQRCPLCPVRSVKLQLFFLQHGSLTARSCLLRCLRISFPSHPGRLVHTF
jgi:hypothetical protein